MAEKFISTIGLEIHAELATKSKMFCACTNNPDEEKPNINICPICMGHPGTLPVLNHEAIKSVLKIGHAVGGTIADFTEWDRKNYFYPDIPKGYQISQYKYPLVSGGVLLKENGNAGTTITRIHLEEDTAQSTHDLTHAVSGRNIADKSLVNYNRAGVPLMELVTEPVIHDAVTAVRFAKELQLLLRYMHAGKANLEKGEMRVEANISVATPEDTAAGKFGTKTEVKNLNSFRAVERAIAYEIDRQIKAIEKGESIKQETRGWDDNAQKTFSQRAKESSHDYRYFPEPDIPKLKISELSEFSAHALQKDTPELPWIRRARLKTDYDMTDKEVAVFVENEMLYAYFDDTLKALSGDTKLIRLFINYFLTDYVGLLKKKYGDAPYFDYIVDISSKSFAALVKLTADGKINSRGAKDILAVMLEGKSGADFIDPEKIAAEKGLIQKSDTGELKKIAAEMIAANPQVVADYKAGKTAALMSLVGQGMKATKGSANPALLKDAFTSLLDIPA